MTASSPRLYGVTKRYAFQFRPQWGGFMVLFLLLAFMFMFPVQSSAQTFKLQNLAALRAVHVVVEDIGQDGKDLGITEEDLKAHLIVLLRNKVPKLSVKASAWEYIYLNVTLNFSEVGERKVGFHGNVELEVVRPGTIEGIRGTTLLEVWKRGMLIGGPLNSVSMMVRENVERLVTLLAADWLQANP